MKELKELYDLKNDTRRIKLVQEASLDKTSNSGLKIENGRLFGTEEWFSAIDSGAIRKQIVCGVISDLRLTGHNDFVEMEIDSNGTKTIWEILGGIDAYKIGLDIELAYVVQKYKRSFDDTEDTSKCIVQIKIG